LVVANQSVLFAKTNLAAALFGRTNRRIQLHREDGGFKDEIKEARVAPKDNDKLLKQFAGYMSGKLKQESSDRRICFGCDFFKTCVLRGLSPVGAAECDGRS
jgi:hypothetical protein